MTAMDSTFDNIMLQLEQTADLNDGSFIDSFDDILANLESPATLSDATSTGSPAHSDTCSSASGDWSDAQHPSANGVATACSPTHSRNSSEPMLFEELLFGGEASPEAHAVPQGPPAGAPALDHDFFVTVEDDDEDDLPPPPSPPDFLSDVGGSNGSDVRSGREAIDTIKIFFDGLNDAERAGVRDLMVDEGLQALLSTNPDIRLDKHTQSQLKKIRRKVRNKLSAASSRKRRKNYVGTLEERVTSYVEYNNLLKKRVSKLEAKNKTLAAQMRKMRELLAPSGPAQAAAKGTGACLMVLLFSFALLFNPASDGTTNAVDATGSFQGMSSSVARSLKAFSGASESDVLANGEESSNDTQAIIAQAIEHLHESGMSLPDHSHLKRATAASLKRKHASTNNDNDDSDDTDSRYDDDSDSDDTDALFALDPAHLESKQQHHHQSKRAKLEQDDDTLSSLQATAAAQAAADGLRRSSRRSAAAAVARVTAALATSP